MSTILRKLDMSTKRHATNARASATYVKARAMHARAQAKLRNSYHARLLIVKGALASR